MQTAILCGIDGSPDSRAALEVAARLAGRLGARLVLAHVVELAHIPYAAVGPMGAPPSTTMLAVANEDAGRRLLDRVAHETGLVDAERRTAIGFPAERLADLADEEHAELVVVGSRGRGAFKAAFLGSVSRDLVGAARCPVLVVPPGAVHAS
jgi:nucleotide-binding universal stress UspA family protein